MLLQVDLFLSGGKTRWFESSFIFQILSHQFQGYLSSPQYIRLVWKFMRLVENLEWLIIVTVSLYSESHFQFFSFFFFFLEATERITFPFPLAETEKLLNLGVAVYVLYYRLGTVLVT